MAATRELTLSPLSFSHVNFSDVCSKEVAFSKSHVAHPENAQIFAAMSRNSRCPSVYSCTPSINSWDLFGAVCRFKASGPVMASTTAACPKIARVLRACIFTCEEASTPQSASAAEKFVASNSQDQSDCNTAAESVVNVTVQKVEDWIPESNKTSSNSRAVCSFCAAALISCVCVDISSNV